MHSLLFSKSSFATRQRKTTVPKKKLKKAKLAPAAPAKAECPVDYKRATDYIPSA